MPAIMRKNIAAGTANALDGLKFQNLPGPALLTLYATTAVAGGTVSLSVDNDEVLDTAGVNIESSADVVDVDRDLVLWKEPVAAGKLFLAVDSQICNFLLMIDYV